MSCAAWRSTSAALWPARSSNGSTSEGLPMICGGGTSSGGGPRPGGLLGIRSVRSSQSPPRFRMLKVPFSPTLRAAAAAPAAPPAMIVSAAWMPDSRSRPPSVGGFGGFRPSFFRACPGSMPPSSLSGRKEGLVNSRGGRGKGTPS